MAGGKIEVANVPPEEFLINREAKEIQDARFICHRVRKTLSELKVMWPDIDVEDLKGADGNSSWDTGDQSRFSFDSSGNMFGLSNAASEESMQEYYLHESYITTDFDDDGIAELRKVCTVGSTVLSNEEIDNIPFISITPIKIPHKFYGLSIADLVMPLQEMKSTLIRNLLDNMYNQNYGRYAVLEGQANLDDLLTARPGGIVRVKSPQAVTPLATPTLEPYTFQMLEYIDSIREERAGVSKTSQGLNPDALTSHTTATAVNAVMTASQSRIELVARQFAETGVKELMLRIYELLVKNMDRKTVIKLRGSWVDVDPTSWVDHMYCTVSVALGHGNKDMQIGQLQQLVQMAGQAKSGGSKMISEQNMFNLVSALMNAMGYQNVTDYITPPEQQPPPPPPDPMIEAQLEAVKVDTAVKQGELKVKEQKAETELMDVKMDNKFKLAELAAELETGRPMKIG
jgi:GTPase SAR1 family protein